MTDRTDSVNPAENEPSSGGTADEIAWPVWGASSARPALRRETPAEPTEPTEPPASTEPAGPETDGSAQDDEPDAQDAATPDADPAPDTAGASVPGVAPAADETRDEGAVDDPADASSHDAAQNAAPDVADPDVAEPDVVEPDVVEPDVAEPDVAEPDVAEPDVAEPDVAEPDVAEPDVAEPDVAEPDVVEPRAAEPGAVAPEPTGQPHAEAGDGVPVVEPVVEPVVAVAAEPEPGPATGAEASDEPEIASEPETAPEAAPERELETEAAAERESEPETAPEPEAEAAPEPEPEAALEPAPAPEAAPEPEPEAVPSAHDAAARPGADPTAVMPAVEAREATDRAGEQAPGRALEQVSAQPPVLPPVQDAGPVGVPQRESVLGRRDDATAQAPHVATATTPAAATPPAGPAAPSSAPVPPALAGSARVSAGPVPQTPREASPFDEFEAEPVERRWPRRLLIGAGVLVVLVGGYVGACYATADRVPRGTSVAGVDVGGLSSADAVDRLGTELAATTGTAVAVQANDVQASLDPAAAGLSFDARATVDELTGVDLADPVRLWHQVAGLGEHEPVTQVDQAKLTGALEALGTSLSLAPVDGQVMFVEGAAMMTDATDGWALDEAAAADVVARDWLVAAQPLALPTTVVEPEITQAEAQAALDDVARPLVSAPISVTVQDHLAVLQPATVAAAASMQPQDGDLVLRLDGAALAKEIVDQLPEGVLTSASDAHFEFQDDKPVLVPGEPGTTVAPDDVAAAVAAVASAQDRTADVALSETDPAETTEAMEKLGVKEIVSEFSTPLTAETQRTINIRQGLANITGVLIRPGETFSLTEALGPIDKAHGFVPAGAIVNGEHSDAWGGGLSQVSTTTFNAAYLAGMEDVEHTPHSEWFARYPEGREATIYTGVLDMKWKNTTPYGALVQGWIADGRAYVRIWGTKYWTVESTTSGRSGVVQPSTIYSDSRSCTPSSAGNPGFTVTVTRKLFLDGDLQDTTAKTWRYKPQNRVVCGPPPSKDDTKDAKDAKE